MAGKIIFGLNAVREALASGRYANRLYIAKESHAKGANKLVDTARAQSLPVDYVPQAKLNTLTGTQEHQGIAAAISPVEYTTLEACLETCPTRATLLLLDQVHHSRNLGLMIRTATGAGATALILAARGGALLDETVLRASAGTVLRLPIVRCANLSQAIRKLKSENFWVYGLEPQGGQNLFTIDWPERCALVAGNETSGLRPGVRKACDALVTIPRESELDSLNVATATGIALFQARDGRGRKEGS